jgi:acyl dehydratase
MIDYHVVKSWKFEDVRYPYTARDSMLYALSVGLGVEPTDRGQLRYVYEKDLHAVPTMATVMGAPGAWWRDPRTGANALKLVHGEQSLRIIRPLPAQGCLIARNRVHSLSDKGKGRGAIGVVLRDLLDEATGELVAQSRNVSFLRGDGGFSAFSGASDPLPDQLPSMPEGPADIVVDISSLPQAALIYRLTGDLNPLHADPAIATAAGFTQPILHGLCTYGMACHAVLRAALSYDARRLRAIAARFTAPVYPGEEIRFELWQVDDQTLRLRARVMARDAIVLDNGVIETD